MEFMPVRPYWIKNETSEESELRSELVGIHETLSGDVAAISWVERQRALARATEIEKRLREIEAEARKTEARQARGRTRKGTPRPLSSLSRATIVMSHNGRPRSRRREVLSDRRGKRKFITYTPVVRDGVPVTLKASELRFMPVKNYWEN